MAIGIAFQGFREERKQKRLRQAKPRNASQAKAMGAGQGKAKDAGRPSVANLGGGAMDPSDDLDNELAMLDVHLKTLTAKLEQRVDDLDTAQERFQELEQLVAAGAALSSEGPPAAPTGPPGTAADLKPAADKPAAEPEPSEMPTSRVQVQPPAAGDPSSPQADGTKIAAKVPHKAARGAARAARGSDID